MDVYCDMNGDGWAYPHCPAVGGCITSYTKERRGPSSSWGADTENGHTASGTPSLATNPHTLLRRTQSCFSRSYGCSHFSFHHQTMGFFTGAGGRAALRKLCTRPVCVHECVRGVSVSVCARATLEGLLWVSGGKGQSAEFPPLWPFVTSGF